MIFIFPLKINLEQKVARMLTINHMKFKFRLSKISGVLNLLIRPLGKMYILREVLKTGQPLGWKWLMDFWEPHSWQRQSAHYLPPKLATASLKAVYLWGMERILSHGGEVRCSAVPTIKNKQTKFHSGINSATMY